MPFTITEPDDEETMELSRFSEMQYQIEQPEEDTSFSLAKDVGGPLRELGLGAYDAIARSFGAGPDTQIGDPELDRRFYKSEGMSDEEIEQKMQFTQQPMGRVIRQNTEILDPENIRQQRIGDAMNTIGSFLGGMGVLPPGMGGIDSLSGLMDTFKMGAKFAAGEALADYAGAGPWGKFITGLTFANLTSALKSGSQLLNSAIGFGRGLLKKPEQLEGIPKFFEEVATPKAFADLELSQKDLVGRIAKTSAQDVEKFESMANKVGEPEFRNIDELRAKNFKNDIIEANRNQVLDEIAPKGESTKKNWESIQDYVDTNVKASEESYRSLYNLVDEYGQRINTKPENTFEAVKKLNRELRQSLLRAREEGGISSSVKELQNKLTPDQDELARMLKSDLQAEGIVADFNEVKNFLTMTATEGSPRDIPVSRLTATARSIGRILSKSDIIPAPVDLLRSIQKGLKADIRGALEPYPILESAYENAERIFAETKKVFENDAIRKLRTTQNPEDMPSLFSKPSNMQRLKKALGNEKNAVNLSERSVVDHITKKGNKLARETSREIAPELSPQARASMEEIIEQGDTLTSPGQQNAIRGNLFEDLQKSFDSGARPKYALDLMKTDTGYKIVKDTLNRSAKGREIFKSLQRMTLNDVMASVKGDVNAIDYTKVDKILEDPHMQRVVKESLGDEGFKFFKNLETYGKNFKENLRKFSAQDPSVMQKALDKFFTSEAKGALYAIAYYTKGMSILPILGAEAAKRIRKNMLTNILTDQKLRDQFKKMSRPDQTLKQFEKNMGKFGTQLSQKDEDDSSQ